MQLDCLLAWRKGSRISGRTARLRNSSPSVWTWGKHVNLPLLMHRSDKYWIYSFTGLSTFFWNCSILAYMPRISNLKGASVSDNRQQNANTFLVKLIISNFFYLYCMIVLLRFVLIRRILDNNNISGLLNGTFRGLDHLNKL